MNRLEERIQQDQSLAYETVLSSQNGRRFLWMLLSFCGIYQDIHTDDPREDARRLGQRSVGLWLLQELEKVDSEQVLKMMREGKADTEMYASLEKQELDKGNSDEISLGADDFI